MTDVDIPCPNCHESLVLDQETSGLQVVCPYCDSLVQMPVIPIPGPGASPAKDAGQAPRGGLPTARGAGESPKSLAMEPSPLSRVEPLPLPPPERRSFVTLPSGREFGELASAPAPAVQSAEPPAAESRHAVKPELRRQSAAPTGLDVHKIDTKGLIPFPCPSCGRSAWVKKKQTGDVIECESCSAEVTVPDVEKGEVSQVVKAPPAGRGQKAVLPTQKGLLGRLPKENIQTPKEVLDHLHKSELPAPRSLEAAPNPHLPARRAVDAVAPAAFTGPAGTAERWEAGFTGAEQSKSRPMTPERKLKLAPKGEYDADAEAVGQWGVDQEAAEVRRRRNRRLMVAGIVIALPLVAGLLYQTLSGMWSTHPVAESKAAGAARSSSDELEQAQAVLKQFVGAKTIGQLAGLVRHPEVTVPRMEAWYAKVPAEALTVRSLRSSMQAAVSGQTRFVLVGAEFGDFKTREMAMTKVDGKYLVDWESWAGWSEVTWKEFLTKDEVAGPYDFPVWVQVDNYYNGGYNNEEKFFCFKLVDVENWASCWGYCGLDDLAGKDLMRILRKKAGERGAANKLAIRAILKLRREAQGVGKNQLWIDAVVADGWVRE